jgi:hypothetical protein
MSCINTIWHCRDHFLVMYDTQSGITIEDALNRDGESIFSAQLMHLTYFLKGCVFFIFAYV